MLSSPKDLGERREGSRSLRRNNRAFGSLAYSPHTRAISAPAGTAALRNG